MRLPLLLACFAPALVCTSCVSVKSTDEEQLPSAWRQALSTKAVGDISGHYLADGRVVRSDGKVTDWTLVELFFPGRYLRRERPTLDRGELKLGDNGTVTFTGFSGGAAVLSESFGSELDAATGERVVHIPVSDKYNKFGAVATTRRARLKVGSDHALYVHVRDVGAGVVLFMPAAGTASMWGRWDAVPTPTGAPAPRP